VDEAKAIIRAIVAPAPKGEKNKKSAGKKASRRPALVPARPRSANVSLPAAIGGMSVSSVSGINETVVIPFQGMDIRVYNGTGSASAHFAPTWADGAKTSTLALDLHPLSADSHPATFGLSIAQLASCFVNWRVRTLKVQFIPLFGTSQGGVIAFGYRNDARDNDAPASVQEVCTCGDNLITPVWSPAEMDLSSTLRTTAQNWYYTNLSVDSEDTDRTTSPGSFQAFIDLTSNVSNDQIIGYFRFSGVIEFRSLARADLLGAKRHAHEEEKYLAPSEENTSRSDASPYFMVSGPNTLASSLTSQLAPPMNRHGSLPGTLPLPPSLNRS